MFPGGTPVCSETVRKPAAMASDGSSGVEASLKTWSRRATSKTKSVKVPPVSTPTRTARSRRDLDFPVLFTTILDGSRKRAYSLECADQSALWPVAAGGDQCVLRSLRL